MKEQTPPCTSPPAPTAARVEVSSRWLYRAALSVGLIGLAVVALTADHPTSVWRKFAAVVAASLCYLSLFHLSRLQNAPRRRHKRSKPRRAAGR